MLRLPSNPSRRWLSAVAVLTQLWLCGGQAFGAELPGTVVGWGDARFSQTVFPQGLPEVVAVAGGSVWSLALTREGTVYGWGKNTVGEATGVPTRNFNTPTNAFVTVNGALLTNAVAIAAGGFYGNDYGHSLAVLHDGTVVAWGDRPGGGVVPAEATNVVAIAAGGYHSVALRRDGTVRAWGADWNGSTSSASTLSDVVAIAAGGRYTLALKADGSVLAFGASFYGETSVPPGLRNVVAIAAGATHALALTTEGFVVSWGSQTNVPAGLSNVIAIAASGSESGNHSLALKNDGTVVAWGQNDRGQTNGPADLGNVIAIAAGSKHSLAITAPLRLQFVGLNDLKPALSFRTFAGQEYTVQFTSDLNALAWTPLPNGFVAGTGSDVIVEDADPVNRASRRFYRLVRMR